MKPNQLLTSVCFLLAIILIVADKTSVIDDKPDFVWAVTVVESDNRSPQLSALLANPEVRDIFPEFRIVDPDDNVEPVLANCIKLAKNPPTLFLLDPKGKIHWQGSPPTSVASWKTLEAEVTKNVN